ncbi:MAG: hypothetical protein ACE5D3_08475 [Candidatus Binatia bacterium]
MGLALTLALLVALASVAYRAVRRARTRRVLASLPGASAETAIRVGSFDRMDDAIQQRRCHCGGFLTNLGEGSARSEERVLRLVRVECRKCEEQSFLYFDLSQLYH